MKMPAQIEEKFNQYPDHIKPLMLNLRQMILQIAEELQLGEVEESLKWGEPSYLVKQGSPIRMDWKVRTPENYFLFFHCQTKLVETFRELYPAELEFEGKRAIVFSINKKVPNNIISHCFRLAMQYKTLKHLPLLGA